MHFFLLFHTHHWWWRRCRSLRRPFFGQRHPFLPSLFLFSLSILPIITQFFLYSNSGCYSLPPAMPSMPLLARPCWWCPRLPHRYPHLHFEFFFLNNFKKTNNKRCWMREKEVSFKKNSKKDQNPHLLGNF